MVNNTAYEKMNSGFFGFMSTMEGKNELINEDHIPEEHMVFRARIFLKYFS
jgi:hypothetical protein